MPVSLRWRRSPPDGWAERDGRSALRRATRSPPARPTAGHCAVPQLRLGEDRVTGALWPARRRAAGASDSESANWVVRLLRRIFGCSPGPALVAPPPEPRGAPATDQGTGGASGGCACPSTRGSGAERALGPRRVLWEVVSPNTYIGPRRRRGMSPSRATTGARQAPLGTPLVAHEAAGHPGTAPPARPVAREGRRRDKPPTPWVAGEQAGPDGPLAGGLDCQGRPR